MVHLEAQSDLAGTCAAKGASWDKTFTQRADVVPNPGPPDKNGIEQVVLVVADRTLAGQERGQEVLAVLFHSPVEDEVKTADGLITIATRSGGETVSTPKQDIAGT